MVSLEFILSAAEGNHAGGGALPFDKLRVNFMLRANGYRHPFVVSLSNHAGGDAPFDYAQGERIPTLAHGELVEPFERGK